jgi:hypothetical protein
LEIRMHRLLLALATTAALLAGAAFAQQQVRVTGVQIDELVELPPEMRLGVFIDQGEGARELGSVRMVAGTFDLDSAGLLPEERDLRALASGSFPLAFMIGNEFVVDREGARFATAWLQPYHDQNDSGAYEELFDEWFFRAPPELTDPFGYFNLVYVDRDVVLRTTPAEFALRTGWNLVVARVEGGALAYDVATSVSDVVVYSYGTNRTFENLDRPEDAPEAPEAP